jgi:hypothetical protein
MKGPLKKHAFVKQRLGRMADAAGRVCVSLSLSIKDKE